MSRRTITSALWELAGASHTEFLNGYCERDGLEPTVVLEALKIASERDARRVGYVRGLLENWSSGG